MPRRPRLTLPGIPLHLIQRGNNHQIGFVTDDDCRFYLELLGEYTEKAGCRIHAYVLMSNHVHRLVVPDTAGATTRLATTAFANKSIWRYNGARREGVQGAFGRRAT